MTRCADPRHPAKCLGPKVWDTGWDDGGIGCGVPEHPAGCLCDVVLRGEK